MSIMSSFFIAKSNLAAKKAPTTSVEATDITDIEVSNLDEIVTGVADRSLDAIETDEGDDAMVFLLHPKFVAALAAANADALPGYASRWAQSDELADAVRLYAECGAAHHGRSAPGSTEPQPGLLPRCIPVGRAIVVRTPTVAARLKLDEAFAQWHFPQTLDTESKRRDYKALLIAWILHHGRDEEQLALLSADSAPALVAAFAAQCPVTIEELDAAFAEVVEGLYPVARIMDKYEALADLAADNTNGSKTPREGVSGETASAVAPDIDWAAVLLTLVTEAGGSAETWLASYEPRVFHILAAIRRRREREAAAAAAATHGAPDPQCPKSRAARAWNAFEQAVLTAVPAVPAATADPEVSHG
jgi:hypothetical protein